MSRFRYKHIQSTVENREPSSLLDGEIAVNRFAGKEKLFIKNSSGNVVSFSSDSAIDGKLAEKLSVSDFNTYSGAVDTAINSKASESDLSALSGTVTGHTADTDIHVTTADKTAWNAKLDSSDVADFFDNAKYELSGTTHVINFYNDNTIKATIDAEPFIVDGMVESVSAVTSGNTTVLDIKWNTAAGGQETIIDIGDIFEADNYYQKSQTSGATELATAFGDINDIIGSGFTSSSITDVIIENEDITSAALTDLDNRKLDASAYTPTDLSNYYTKSETSGATELSTAFAGKADTSHTHASSAVTSMEGYAMAASGTPITTADTLNQAIGKLEKQNDEVVDFIEEKELAIAAAITDLDDRKLDKSTNKVTVTAITTNKSSSCSITGASNDGNSETIIYTNSTNSNLIVTVPTIYKTPNNAALEIICLSGGYCEVSYINVNGVIYARAI